MSFHNSFYLGVDTNTRQDHKLIKASQFVTVAGATELSEPHLNPKNLFGVMRSCCQFS